MVLQEPGLTTSRLAMMIDSLAAGADVFSSRAQSGTEEGDIGQINEMEMVLDGPV